MQSKTASAVETVLKVGTNFVVAILLQHFVVPLFYEEMQASADKTLGITLIFTANSLVMTYGFRRIFTRIQHRNRQILAQAKVSGDSLWGPAPDGDSGKSRGSRS